MDDRQQLSAASAIDWQNLAQDTRNRKYKAADAYNKIECLLDFSLERAERSLLQMRTDVRTVKCTGKFADGGKKEKSDALVCEPSVINLEPSIISVSRSNNSLEVGRHREKSDSEFLVVDEPERGKGSSKESKVHKCRKHASRSSSVSKPKRGIGSSKKGGVHKSRKHDSSSSSVNKPERGKLSREESNLNKCRKHASTSSSASKNSMCEKPVKKPSCNKCGKRVAPKCSLVDEAAQIRKQNGDKRREQSNSKTSLRKTEMSEEEVTPSMLVRRKCDPLSPCAVPNKANHFFQVPVSGITKPSKKKRIPSKGDPPSDRFAESSPPPGRRNAKVILIKQRRASSSSLLPSPSDVDNIDDDQSEFSSVTVNRIASSVNTPISSTRSASSFSNGSSHHYRSSVASIKYDSGDRASAFQSAQSVSPAVQVSTNGEGKSFSFDFSISVEDPHTGRRRPMHFAAECKNFEVTDLFVNGRRFI